METIASYIIRVTILPNNIKVRISPDIVSVTKPRRIDCAYYGESTGGKRGKQILVRNLV